MRYLFSGTRLRKFLGARRLFLCLDFDGTLAPIRRSPEAACLSAARKRILAELAGTPGRAVAVISGRSLADIEGKAGARGVICAGDHGFAIRYDGKLWRPFYSRSVRSLVAAFRDAARAPVAKARGALMEDKGMTLTIHYRRVPKASLAELREAVYGLSGRPSFRDKLEVRQGKMSFEIRPRLPWDKGGAVMWLLLRLLKDTSCFYLPLYIGDDTTDEDAFRVVNSLGMTVRVGRKSSSCARYYVKNTSEVFRLLSLAAGARS